MTSISKSPHFIKRYLKTISETTIAVPVILVIIGISINFDMERAARASSANVAGVVGGPADFAAAIDTGSDAAVMNSSNPNDAPPASSEDDEAIGSIIVGDSAVLNTGNPQSTILAHRDGLVVYKVQPGDTLSKIAANFGISLGTIYQTNKDLKNKALRLGEEITILPVSGVIHQVQNGETLSSIAALYEIPEARILKYNRQAVSGGLVVGANVIVPGVSPKNNALVISGAQLPDFSGYYALPTTGWNWGKLHNYNAVDIANACGTPIYASADGLVVDGQSGGWNEGYGSYIMIEHPNSTKTRYAHNQKNVVSVGDYVLQGDTIGYIGNTGNTHGPTGCHVHFEVYGARNPFAK